MNFKISEGSVKKDSKNSFEKLLSRFDSDGKDWQHAELLGSRRRGCSSVVERDLAKVDVESSNLFTRSIFLRGLEGIPGLCYLQLSLIV